MTSAQTRIADHVSTFYSAADRTSDGAMAAHAYKQSVIELDDVIGRELVRLFPLSYGSILTLDPGLFSFDDANAFFTRC